MVCPRCKHQPFSSTPKKALRNTAKAILKSMQANVDASKIPVAPSAEIVDQPPHIVVKAEEEEEEAQNAVSHMTVQAPSVEPPIKIEDRTYDLSAESDAQVQLTTEVSKSTRSHKTELTRYRLRINRRIAIQLKQAWTIKM